MADDLDEVPEPHFLQQASGARWVVDRPIPTLTGLVDTTEGKRPQWGAQDGTKVTKILEFDTGVKVWWIDATDTARGKSVFLPQHTVAFYMTTMRESAWRREVREREEEGELREKVTIAIDIAGNQWRDGEALYFDPAYVIDRMVAAGDSLDVYAKPKPNSPNQVTFVVIHIMPLFLLEMRGEADLADWRELQEEALDDYLGIDPDEEEDPEEEPDEPAEPDASAFATPVANGNAEASS